MKKFFISTLLIVLFFTLSGCDPFGRGFIIVVYDNNNTPIRCYQLQAGDSVSGIPEGPRRTTKIWGGNWESGFKKLGLTQAECDAANKRTLPQ